MNMSSLRCKPLPWFALLGLSACQSTAVALKAASDAHAPRAQAVEAPARAATPAPVPDTAEPTLVAGAKLAAPASPFTEQVRLPSFGYLTTVGERAFLATGGLVLPIESDAVVVEPELLDGLPTSGSVRLHGSYPDGLWALADSYEERTTTAELWQWSGRQWQSANTVLDGALIVGMTRWKDGGTLALASGGYRGRLRFSVLGAQRSAGLPTFGPKRSENEACFDGIQPAALTGLTSGEVFLAGQACEADANDDLVLRGAAVQRWAAGRSQGTLEILPGLAAADTEWSEISSVVAHAGNDVWVAGTYTNAAAASQEAYVAHFDGEHWQRWPAPPEQRVDELQRSPNGALWALCSGHLWHLPVTEEGKWQPVALPTLAATDGDLQFSSIWAKSDEEVWATVDSGETSYLVRTGARAKLQLPETAELKALQLSFKPYIDEDECPEQTLVLLKLGRNAPANADSPRVRALLRKDEQTAGLQLVEFTFLGRRYLGLRGDSVALNVASYALYDAQLPGITPEPRCIAAPATRTLSLGGKPPASTARR